MVISADDKIDVLEHQVEEKAILTIAKRQPMAQDLRQIMVTIRIAADLERIESTLARLAEMVGRRLREHKLSDSDEFKHFLAFAEKSDRGFIAGK